MSDIRPECEERFINIHDDIQEMKAGISDIRKAVIGNGNPKDSMASRVERHDTWLKLLGAGLFLACAVGGVIAAIIQAMK